MTEPTWKPHNPPYLQGEAALDGVARMVIALAREVWVLRDRLAVTETLLEQHGVFPRASVDTFVPSEDFTREAELESDAFVERVLGAPFVEALPIDDVVEQALRWTEATRERAGAAAAAS